MRMNLRIFSNNCTILTCTKKAALCAAFSDLGGIPFLNPSETKIKPNYLYNTLIYRQYYFTLFHPNFILSPFCGANVVQFSYLCTMSLLYNSEIFTINFKHYGTHHNLHENKKRKRHRKTQIPPQGRTQHPALPQKQHRSRPLRPDQIYPGRNSQTQSKRLKHQPGK